MPRDASRDTPGAPESDVLARTLHVVGERWNLLILRDMWVLGPRRFGQLQRTLRIARNVLSDRLRALLADGVVERRLYQDHPERYEYLLSADGKELVPPMLLLAAWGDRHLAGEAGAPMLFLHRNRRHLVDPVAVCRHCGEELTIHSLEPLTSATAPEGQP